MRLSPAPVLLALVACRPAAEDTADTSAPPQPLSCAIALVVSGSEDDLSVAMTPTADGGMVYAGSFVGDATVDGQSWSAPNGGGIAVAVDAAGDTRWTHVVGAGGRAEVTDVAASGDWIWLAGAYEGAADLGLGAVPDATGLFLTRLDAAGAVQEVLTFPGGHAVARLAPAPDGGVYLAGQHDDAVQVGATAVPADTLMTCGRTFLTRVAPSTGPSWVSDFDDALHGLSSTDAGVCMLQHDFCALLETATYTFVAPDGEVGPTTIQSRAYSAVWLDDGGYAIGGRQLLRRFDATGEAIWDAPLRLDGEVYIVRAVTAGADGGLVAVGGLNGSLDYGGEPLVTDQDVAPDAFALVIAPGGALTGFHVLQGNDWDEASAVAVDAAGRLHVGMTTSSTVTYGEDTHTPQGKDLLFARCE